MVGLGLALLALGRYLVYLDNRDSVGWFAYAPLQATAHLPRGPHVMRPWLRLIIWLGLILVWTLASVRILRPPEKADESRRQATQ